MKTMIDEKIDTNKAAEIIAHLFFIGAHKDSEQIVREIEESQKLTPSSVRFGQIFNETLYFYLNLVDRLAFEYLRDKRDEFFDELLVQVSKIYFEAHRIVGGNVHEETFYRIFNETQREKQQEYGRFKTTTEKYEGIKGNIFWEFESRLAEILGMKGDLLVVTDIHAILMPNVGHLNEICKKILSAVLK